jgi:DnaK suppressor protein
MNGTDSKDLMSLSKSSLKDSIRESVKDSLLNEKSALLNRSTEFKSEIQIRESASDESDQASRDLAMNSSIQIREKDRLKIAMIERALNKISSGTFGQCESCGDEISPARLVAYPFSPNCINCQEEQEDTRRTLN